MRQFYRMPRKVIAACNAVILTLMLMIVAGLTACGRPATDKVLASNETSTSDDRRALNTISSSTWYDSAEQDYRPPVIEESLDSPIRKTGKVLPPKPPKQKSSRTFRGGSFDGRFLAYALLFCFGAILLGVAIALAYMSMRDWIGSREAFRLNTEAVEIDPTRVVDLPFEAQPEMHDPLGYAKRLVAEGNYNAAVLYLYGYKLLALDRSGKIHLHRGKTNRMYLGELYTEPELKSILTPTMLAFEDVFFGRISIDKDRFMKIWEQLDRFHRLLAPSAVETNQPSEVTI